jgi:predicted AAA+ superfamily ATPase
MELISRGLAGPVADAMREARVVALLGARQAGKSTLARVLAREWTSGEYVTLDEEPARSLALADPQGFVAGLAHGSVIDEVQRAPELLLAIKARVDRDPTPGQLLLTGSANLRRIPTVADALPGRVDYFTLWPFTQGEMAGRREDLLARLFAGEAPRIERAPVGLAHHAERLLRGGFPEAHRRTAATRGGFFQSYVQTLIERDVADAARVHDPASLATLLGLAAARSSGLARYDALARDAGIDGKTAKVHLEVLERLFLLRIRRPWHVNLGKRQIKAPKLYVSDTGLLAALTGADARRLRENGGLAGALLETFVTTELERQASWSPEPLTFWHYREGRHEVDVIVERPSGEILAIETKAGATVRAADVRGLTHLRERLGPRLRAGVLLHPGEHTLPLGERLWALPLQALWEE